MKIFANHKLLFTTVSLLFVGLSLMVAILPALSNQHNNAPLPGAVPLSEEAQRGKRHYIAHGCVACHTQQVRNVAMDEVWGARPGIAADYAANTRMSWWMNTATLMGTERTGPDLTNIGSRMPGIDWHLLHLYNPRAVVEQSIMPAYPWLFEVKAQADEGDITVHVPAGFIKDPGVVVATREVLELVAYLQSLKQVPLPDGTPAQQFLYKNDTAPAKPAATEAARPVLDGAALYATYCQACHQANGAGLTGAFPPLKGSPVVLDEDAATIVGIIMKGYDAREEYGVMPAIGTVNALTADEVAAIINYERTAWGNKGTPITADAVAGIVALLQKDAANP